MSNAFNTVDELRGKGLSLRTAPLSIVFLDPSGDGDDRDALVVIDREEWQAGEVHDPDFAVQRIYRMQAGKYLEVGLEMPDILAILLHVHRRQVYRRSQGRIAGHVFGVDMNGVGWGYASTLSRSTGLDVFPVTTVGTKGKDPWGEKGLIMPRLAGLDNFRLLLEMQQIKCDKEKVEGARELEQECRAFVWRRANYPAALEGQHDDLLMATTGGCWLGEKVIPPLVKAVSYRSAASKRRAA